MQTFLANRSDEWIFIHSVQPAISFYYPGNSLTFNKGYPHLAFAYIFQLQGGGLHGLSRWNSGPDGTLSELSVACHAIRLLISR